MGDEMYSTKRDVERDDGALDPLLPENFDDEPYRWNTVVLPFLFPALAGLLYGYDIGATSGASVSIASRSLSGTDWYELTSLQMGLVVSGSLYGALIGSALAFRIADYLGRRKQLITAAMMYILGALMTSFAPNLAIVILGRLIFGIGIGLSMHAAPMYIAETAPSRIRGTLISLKEALIVGGMLLGYFVGWAKIDTIGGWRFMFGFAAPIGALVAVGMWWLPPSPRWLLLRAVQGKGVEDDLKYHASNAHRRLKQCTKERAEYETEETWHALQLACQGDSGNSTLFQGVSLKALTIAVGLVFFQQFTGQPSVLYYAAPILRSAGFRLASDATEIAVLLGLFKLIMTIVAVLYVDKLGRRPLLIGGVTGVTISLVILSTYFSYLKGFPYLAVGALLLYVGCYQVSFGPISWLMVSEIFPIRTRGRALSITSLINFGSNAVVALAFAPLQHWVGDTCTFIIFGLISVLALLFIVTTVPETKGLSLEQIEAKLMSK